MTPVLVLKGQRTIVVVLARPQASSSGAKSNEPRDHRGAVARSTDHFPLAGLVDEAIADSPLSAIESYRRAVPDVAVQAVGVG